MTTSNLSGLIGMSNDMTDRTRTFDLGTVVISGNTTYTYVQAATAQAAGATTGLTAGFLTTAGSTHTHDLPAPGVPINQFYWARRVVSPL